MKLKPAQLQAHLQSKLGTAYFVSGDETLLVMETCDQIRAAAREQSILERDLFHVEAGFDWNQLFDATSALSLFSDRRIIEIRLSAKLNEPARKALVELVSNPNPDNVLLIVSPKVDSSSAKAKWFRNLEENCCHIQIWPLESKQLPQWIKSRLKQKHLDIEDQALEVLSDKVDGNLLAAQQEIEKLALLVEGHLIDEELVNRSVSDSSRYDVFDLTESSLKGDVKKALKVLSGLKGEGIEPPVVLWALSRELRSLSILKSQFNQGVAPAQAFRKQGVWEKRQPAVRSALDRLSVHLILELIQYSGLIDQSIKGQRKTDIWDDLSALTFAICNGRLAAPLSD